MNECLTAIQKAKPEIDTKLFYVPHYQDGQEQPAIQCELNSLLNRQSRFEQMKRLAELAYLSDLQREENEAAEKAAAVGGSGVADVSAIFFLMKKKKHCE